MARYFSVGRVVFLLAMLVGEAGPAAGQEQSAEVDDHYRHAIEFYQKGSYEEAVRELRATYNLNPLPRLLFNLAQAYRKWGHPQEALDHYTLFLRSDPQITPELREEVEGYIKQLQAEPAGPDSPPSGTSESSPVTNPPAVVLQRRPVQSPADLGPRPLYKRPWFWVVVSGVAVAGAVTVGVVAGTASSSSGSVPAGVPVYSW